MVEHPPGMRGDATTDLAEGDGVAVLLEAHGAPHDVEEDLQLRAGEVGQQLIEERIGDRRVVGREEALEAGRNVRFWHRHTLVQGNVTWQLGAENCADIPWSTIKDETIILSLSMDDTAKPLACPEAGRVSTLLDGKSRSEMV